jgi:hypothetical protein
MAPDEWTVTEVEDLKAAINDGLSIEEAAEVLDRADRVDEVIKKCRELGLEPKKRQIMRDISRWFTSSQGHSRPGRASLKSGPAMPPKPVLPPLAADPVEKKTSGPRAAEHVEAVDLLIQNPCSVLAAGTGDGPPKDSSSRSDLDAIDENERRPDATRLGNLGAAGGGRHP